MRKQMSIIMILLVTTFIGFGIIIPVLPDVVSHFHLNLMLAVYSLVGFIVSPLWGRLSDRIGRRPILMTGILGYSLSFFVFAVGLDSLFLMYLSRVLGGLFSGAVTACAVAYVADITSNEERTKGMGLVGMSIGLGFIFGPAAGGLLSVYGNEVPFFISSALAFLTFLFVASSLKESLPPERRKPIDAPRVSRWVAFQGRMKHLYIIAFVVTFTLAALEGTLQYYYMVQFDITKVQMGWMFFISGIVGALIQGGVVRRYIKRGEEPKFMRLGLLLSALGFILMIFSANFVTGALFLAVFSAGNALVRPCVTSLITQKTTVGQGTASGLSSSMDSLGRIGGPLIGTMLYHLNISLPFVFGAIVCLSALFILHRFVVLDRGAQQAGA
ncbi:MFS transporter [Xylanibacillus composti]|uniref:Tetracycline resistance MFS efflux pump n=1 Tax=Xylanibacillus composti TaxID=1572762 RepID=A0A8J4H2K1_9BACL|nr:MFS transporter [Xylanibacillus composti]MDT9724194.1 MFS transporter [Xylanibacillus composti]GIQ68291.1 tetracycline resistance MFS efflux pump [Xylanibacillus composti]